VRRAASALGLAIGEQPSAAGGSSAFPAGLGVPTLDGLGPPGGDLMTEREYVEIDGLVERAALLALTLHLLAASPAAERDLVVHSEERSIA
jgi:glutamate carboxypeptidase